MAEGTSVAQPEQPKKTEDNIIRVGKRENPSYILAVISQFSNGAKEVHLKARGRTISKAVDILEIIKDRHMKDVKSAIKTSTEIVEDKVKGKIRVSAIDILLTK